MAVILFQPQFVKDCCISCISHCHSLGIMGFPKSDFLLSHLKCFYNREAVEGLNLDNNFQVPTRSRVIAGQSIIVVGLLPQV